MRRRSSRHSPRKRARKNLPSEVPTPPANSPEAGSATHTYDGVDVTLIHWMLSLTPVQRLEVLQENVRAILKLRDGDASDLIDTCQPMKLDQATMAKLRRRFRERTG
jgi:hypothetical protein